MAEDDAAALPPRAFRELRDLIVTNRSKLPKRLAQVAAYAIDYPDDMAFGTVARIAEAAEVQPSTLIRFAKALGYDGFSDLQAVFQERLRNRPANYDERLTSLDSHAAGMPSPGALIEGFCGAARRSLERLVERVDIVKMDAAARLLAQADTVYLVGQRRSHPISAYLNYVFGKLRVRSVLIGSPGGTDRETLSFAGPRDAAVVVSFTPYAPTTVEYSRQLTRQGTPLIIITDSPFSPLVSENGVWFEIVENDFEGFRTMAATMTLVMALAVAVAEERRGSDRNATPG
jgi:DNA-binding MurR/RpiR family transcriptional regulator